MNKKREQLLLKYINRLVKRNHELVETIKNSYLALKDNNIVNAKKILFDMLNKEIKEKTKLFKRINDAFDEAGIGRIKEFDDL